MRTKPLRRSPRVVVERLTRRSWNDLAVWRPDGSLEASLLRSEALRYDSLALDLAGRRLLLARREPRQAWLAPLPAALEPR